MKLEREITEHEYAYLHDVLYDVTDKHFTNEEIDEVINKMPDHIKLDAFAWGFSDTCVRDKVFEWYKEECIKGVI